MREANRLAFFLCFSNVFSQAIKEGTQVVVMSIQGDLYDFVDLDKTAKRLIEDRSFFLEALTKLQIFREVAARMSASSEIPAVRCNIEELSDHLICVRDIHILALYHDVPLQDINPRADNM